MNLTSRIIGALFGIFLIVAGMYQMIASAWLDLLGVTVGAGVVIVGFIDLFLFSSYRNKEMIS
jgi:uncharacterized membrane protein